MLALLVVPEVLAFAARFEFVEPFDIEPFDIEPFDVEPFDIEPFDIEPFDIEPFDILLLLIIGVVVVVVFDIFVFIILLALLLLLVVVVSPQAIPSALNAKIPERAKVFFISFLILLSSSKIIFLFCNRVFGTVVSQYLF